MSTTQKSAGQESNVSFRRNAVSCILAPKGQDLGRFSVRRTLPSSEQRVIGPWVCFKHPGPATFTPGDGINVRSHPHVNLATATYLFEGKILHRDSLESVQLIKPFDINLMVAKPNRCNDDISR